MNGAQYRQQFLDILKENSIQQSFPLTSHGDFQTHFPPPAPVNHMNSSGKTSSNSNKPLVSLSLKCHHKAYQQQVPSLKLKLASQLNKHHSNKQNSLSMSCPLSHNNWNANAQVKHEKCEDDCKPSISPSCLVEHEKYEVQTKYLSLLSSSTWSSEPCAKME